MARLVQFPNAFVSPRRWALVRGLLTLSIIATVAAVAIKTYRGDSTAFNSFLSLNFPLSKQVANRLESICLAMVLAVTAFGLVRPNWYWLLPAALWILVESILRTQVSGAEFYQIAPAAAALRYCTPIGSALLFGASVHSQPSRPSCSRCGAILLRIAAGIVFLSHGYEAWQHKAGFLDLIRGSASRQMDVLLGESQVAPALSVIGAVDILVGLGLLLGWNRYLLAWAAVWGFITALSRMTSLGWEAYPEVLYRATHFIVPFALMLLVWNRSGKGLKAGNASDKLT